MVIRLDARLGTVEGSVTDCVDILLQSFTGQNRIPKAELAKFDLTAEDQEKVIRLLRLNGVTLV